MFILFEVLKDEIYYLPESLLADVGVVVDLGANIGMSALYFCSRIPSARIVCVEPDPNNLAVLHANASSLHCSVMVIEGAVSYSDGEGVFIGGESWGGALAGPDGVSDSVNSATMVKCMTMERIMEDADIERIDLLKIDIEGGELGLLSRPGTWCVFRRSRSAFRAEADQDSGAMTITFGAKRRWLVS
jgi:FkbM family methyltransferase